VTFFAGAAGAAGFAGFADAAGFAGARRGVMAGASAFVAFFGAAFFAGASTLVDLFGAAFFAGASALVAFFGAAFFAGASALVAFFGAAFFARAVGFFTAGFFATVFFAVFADFFSAMNRLSRRGRRPTVSRARAPQRLTDRRAASDHTRRAPTRSPVEGRANGDLVTTAERPLEETTAPRVVLGIESSCDETAAAVVRLDGGDVGAVLTDVIATQIAEHAPYGGVVPEIASRAHLRAISRVVREAVEGAGGWSVIEGVAVTSGPGLVGALLVGVQAAKAIAWARGLPLVGVNHLAGHLLAPFLARPQAVGATPSFPFVALLASGGHTALYRADGPTTFRELGATRDDAAGEAFDKVAKLLGLGYPGGPVIDRLAVQGDPRAVTLPRSMPGRNLEFSFSGLKTAVSVHVQKHGVPAAGAGLEDLAASVQAAIVDTLVRKLMLAVAQEGVAHVVLSGGVAANRGLREAAARACEVAGVSLHVPPARSCTDNAAMIAYAGAVALRAGRRDGESLNARANWPVEAWLSEDQSRR